MGCEGVFIQVVCFAGLLLESGFVVSKDLACAKSESK